MLRQLFYIICTFLLLCLQAGFSGCIKEYSYEGGPAQDTTYGSIPSDTVSKPAIKFPVCAECENTSEPLLSTWDFKYDGSFLCGNTTRAIISPEQTGFTFFGPSACSIDTGLVMTVYLSNDTLNGDKSNITSTQVIFEYYDNVTLSDIFMTNKLGTFSLTIDKYEYSTRIVEGRFSGSVPAKNGVEVAINNGRFKIKFD